MKILFYFLEKTKLVNLISVLVFVLGLLSLSIMNRDLAPPLNFNRILVDVSYPESTAADLEKEVAFPIEEKLINYPGIKQISSESNQGQVKIWISFPANYKNTSQASNEIRQIIDTLKPYLPENIRSINVSERKITSNFQNAILVRNFDIENAEHRIWLENLKNQLSQIRGIAEIQDGHFPKRSVKIDLNEAKLKSFEANAQIVKQKINDFLQFRPLGSIRRGQNFTYIEFEQNIEDQFIDQLKNLVIFSSPTGFRTTLGQIADVEYYFPAHDQWSFEGDKRSYYLSLRKDLNSDVINLHEKVIKVLEEKNNNSFGISAKSVIGGKSFIDRQLKTLKSNGLIGVIIVFLFLLFFLSFKSAFFTILGVPFSYAATFMFMVILGYDIDILSIVGLILVCGMLVDDALIVCEKYNEGLEINLSPIESAKKCIEELFIPVCGTILTTVVAFLPLLIIPSELGNMLSSIPTVLIAALGFSLIESFFILPNHLSHFVLKPSKSLMSQKFEIVREGYERFVAKTLNWKFSISFLFILITSVILYVSKDIEKDFMLNISDEIVRIDGEVKSSESKQETFAKVKQLYDELIAIAPKDTFENVELGIGSIWKNGENIVSNKVFRVLARVKEDYSQPEDAKNEYLKKAKDIVKKHKKEFNHLTASKTWSEEESDKSKYLTFNFYTKSTKENVDLKKELEQIPQKIKGLGNLDLGQDSSVDRWVFKPDFKKMARYSIDKNLIQMAVLGKVDENWIKEIRIEGKSYPVNFTINSSEITRNGFNPKKVTVLTDNLKQINLSELGDWQLVKSPKSISHLNGYKVQGGKFKILDEKNREQIVKDAEDYVKKIEKNYPQHIIRTSGESLQEAENKSWVIKSLLACILGIFFVLAITLNSITQPFIVSLPIPFAAAGVMLMHKWHGMPLGVFSMIGLIGAIGVSVNGTLIMSDQINLKLQNDQNTSIKDCVKFGAASRLRAIFLTTMTTLGGLFPMAYALGGDSGFTRPLAFSMAWGILFSAVMTLLFFPSIYFSLVLIIKKLENLIQKVPFFKS